MIVTYGVAVFIRILATALSSLGNVIQRRSHVQNDKLAQIEQKNSLKRPLWHAGFWLYLVTSGTGSFFGISSLPILVQAPLGACSLFFNAIYSHFLLHEDMTWIGSLGTLIIAGGAAVIAIILDQPDDKKTTQQLIILLTRTSYIVYITFTFVITAGFAIWGCILIRRHKQIIKTSLHVHGKTRQQMWIAIFFEISASLSASQAFIFAKITYDLVELSFTTGENQFLDSVGFIIMAITAILVVLQLWFFNIALHYYTTVVIIPIGYSLGITLACINTLVYYDSFNGMSTTQTVVVLFCIVAVIVGIMLLARSKSTRIKTFIQKSTLESEIDEFVIRIDKFSKMVDKHVETF